MRDTRWLEMKGLARAWRDNAPGTPPFVSSDEARVAERFGGPDIFARFPGVQPADLTSYSLTPSSTTVTEGNQVTFTITRSGDKPAETLYFSTLSDGTATYAEGDYTTTSGGPPANIAVSFSSGTTSRTVTLNIVSDGTSDSGEQFRAIVQRNASDPVSTYLDRSSYVTINDAAASTSYSLMASPTTVAEGNQVTFTITRSGDKPAETVYFSTLSDGTATYAEGDYATTSGGSPANIAVSFSSGTTSRTVTLNILNDGVSDAGEQFRAIVQRNSSDSVSTYLDRSSYVTINDAASQGTSYSLTPANTAVTEGNQLVFTITRSGDKPAETIYFSTLSDGTATYAEGDYGTTSGGPPANIAVTFSSGATSRTVTLNILSDGVADSGEQFRAIVQRSASDPVSTFLSRSAFVTINDAGAPPPAADDFRDEATDTSAPFGLVTVGSNATGIIGPADSNDTYGDKDVFKVRLEQGQAYEIRLSSTSVNGQSLPLGIFTIRNPANFDQVLETSDVGSNVIENFIADSTGDYYIRVGTGGTAGDQGGYRLSVTSITSSGVADDFPDYPGDSSSVGSTPTLNMGPSRTGVIETVGDTDIFQITLQAGHSYQFSLDSSSAGSAGSLSSLYMTLRNATDFGTRLREDGGIGQAVIPFTAETSGTYYVRVGSGSSSGTGGYRLDVTDLGTAQLPSANLDPDTTPPADAFIRWFDDRFFDATSLGLDITAAQYEYAAYVLSKANLADAAKISAHVQRAFTNYGYLADFAGAIGNILSVDAAHRPREMFVQFNSFLGGLGYVAAGTAGVVALGATAPVTIAVGVGASILWTLGLKDEVEEKLDSIFTSLFGGNSPPGRQQMAPSEAAQAISEDFIPIYFDEQWYTQTYSDASDAISNGLVGSAFAHFLMTGIANGYQPNASQTVHPSELAFSVVNNDASALGNTALMTQSLNNYAGDGTSTAEMMVTSEINNARGGLGAVAVDANLSAIASRKAIDLVANFDASAADSAQSHINAAWAQTWSNGNQFTQQFRGTFEALVGTDTPASSIALFVVSSSSGSGTDVLARLQGQLAFSAAMANAAFDTLGVAEFGGVWVVILADRVTGYSVTTPGADTLTTASIYGSNESESLYAGMRAGRLFGLDGNDTLVSGIGQDYLDGGSGDDIYVLNEAQDRVAELSGGGRDTVFSVVSYVLPSDAAIEMLATSNPQGTAAINLTGNSFGQQIFGNAGANMLDGGDGSDLLVGGAGNDLLIGGGGGDEMYGGAGSDTFAFNSLADMQGFARRSDGAKFFPDVLFDFVSGEDKLDLSAIDAIAGTAANDAFTFVGHSAFSNRAGELRGYIESGMVRLAGDVDGDGYADFTISVAASIYVADIIL